MLMKACSRCGRLVPYGMTRCSECEQIKDSEFKERELKRQRRYNRMRRQREDPKYRAFYRSKDWRMLSAFILSESQHRCEDCGRIACEVHHDPPIQTDEGWEGRLKPSHCHALCVRCHNKRHKRF